MVAPGRKIPFAGHPNVEIVRISGDELWKIGNNGLIAESKGHFDGAEYELQLKLGVDE